MKLAKIISELLGGDDWARKLIGEASVHRPRRGRRWVASFTGVHGQEWRTTGTEDHATALARAKEFEAEARAQRASVARTVGKPRLRVRSAGGPGGGLTQREVALLLGMSERAVRAIEKRALAKLAQHPGLRGIWHNYLAGELTEERHRLSVPEIKALLGLARNQFEHAALQKALALVQNRRGDFGPGKQP